MLKGFTLIEILITMVIIGLTLIVAGPPVVQYIEKRQITASSEDLKSALELMQNRSITVEGQLAHGILIQATNNRYAYVTQNADNSITVERGFPLPNNVKITAPAGNTNIIFTKRSGTLETDQSITLSTSHFLSTITINQAGVINTTPLAMH